MQITEHVSSLRRDGERLADSAAITGLDAVVPTCPGWLVRDLVGHIGGVHRWAASCVLAGNPQAPADKDQAAFAPPGDDGMLEWFRVGHATLVTTLTEADPAVTCWTFLPAPSPLAFWARRQAHETAIHRIDAESAAGAVTGVASDIATDGIDELLAGLLARPRGRLVADPPVTLAVHTTDTDAAWAIRIEADRRVVAPGSREGDCVVAGPASDLYLLLWNRRDPAGLDVQGDPLVLDLWRAKARITWR